MIVHQIDPYNAETPVESLAAGDLTPVESFYIRSHGPVPEVDLAAWRLRVDGLVERELSLSLADLRARFAVRELVATLQCAGNRRAGLIAVREIPGEAPWGAGATGNAHWRGVALTDVLTAAGVRAEAGHIAFAGADRCDQDRFGGSIPRHKALASEVLLAWEMNGEPLAPAHGAPLRAVVPGYIGARSVKWLQRVTAQPEESSNYFQSVAYRLLAPDTEPSPGAGVALGAVAVNADILAPPDGATVTAGPLEVRGYAFAGDDRRIVRVDVSADGGDVWRQAELLDDQGPWAWRRWRCSVAVTPGRAEILARAWDSAAATQPEHPGPLWNPKGYVNNSWARVTVSAER